MPRIVNVLSGVPAAARDAVVQAIPNTADGPLEIVSVGPETLTVFIEREREMIVTPWVFLKKEASRNKTLYCYQRPLEDHPTAQDIRRMLDEFHLPR